MSTSNGKSKFLYILINIGSEKINCKSYLVLNRAEFMIGGSSIECHKYNEIHSSSYNCTYCKSQKFNYGWYSEGIISTEDFNILNDKNETKLFHNIKFILGTKIATDTSIPVTLEGFIGLNLPYYDSMMDYNFFKSLKKANVTNSYYWYLNFDKSGAKMVLDGFPHDLDNKNSRTYDDGRNFEPQRHILRVLRQA